MSSSLPQKKVVFVNRKVWKARSDKDIKLIIGGITPILKLEPNKPASIEDPLSVSTQVSPNQTGPPSPKSHMLLSSPASTKNEKGQEVFFQVKQKNFAMPVDHQFVSLEDLKARYFDPAKVSLKR